MDRKYLFATLALLPLLLLPNRAACAAKQDLFSLSLEQLSNIPVTGSTLSANNLWDVPDTFGSSPITTHDPYFTGSAQLQLSLWQDTRVQWVYAAGHSARFYTLGTIDDSFNRYDTEYSGLQLQQTLHWHPDIDSQLLLGTQYSYLQIDNRPVTAVAVGAISNPPATAPLLLRTDIDSTEYSLNWKNDWRLDSAASLQFGLEYRRPRIAKGIADNNYDLAQLSAHDLPVNYYGDLSHQSQVVKKARLDVVGVYLQYQYHINHQWDGIAGGRYDHYSHIGSHFSPRLGLVTHINDRDSLKLLYGEAFRAPQATELYTINNPVLLGNPDLKPETVSTWELIWQHQWQRSQLALNYFSSLFKNAISQQPVNNVRQFANSHQREHSDGIEGEWKTQLSQFWQLHLTATRLLHTPDTFYREASNLFSATGTYERGRWYGTLATYYRSHRATQIDNTGNRRRLADYWQWQGKVGYRWRERLETYLEVLNALDKDYWTPSLTSHIQRGIPNRGRTLLLGMNWDF